ncbi:carotenoid 1,2-hydratase [Marinobacter halodurans]|uniref:Carotenoid 1,2-hydratase n=1 Tax=Marinobacter halodurans TaxID=2528979 RepID=A0ABY1ZNJ3_9GAMM|nr:lipocalin-like domain-containing protein [Marinobacter halodurans]TBW57916.1 carotenoid 1,2-hydratase [Marinobacter halodurans]
MKWLVGALAALLLVGCEPQEDAPQGFAGLGQSFDAQAGQAGFAQPAPGDRIQLPRDLGPHPRYRIEWWYLTANLTTAGGDPLGLQWTQFRQGLKPHPPDADPPPPETWPMQSVWMAHAAVSRPNDHHFTERLARGGIGHAGATAAPFAVWLDDWSLTATEDGDWRLHVQAGDWGYDLTLTPRSEAIHHGDHGFSAKSSSGEGSMYFSFVDLTIHGTVTVNGETLDVQGSGWFDREWSSQFLRSDQQGWDWMALQLDSGERVMAFRLREEQGAFLAGTWISAFGEVVPLTGDDFTLQPLEQQSFATGTVPSRWRLTIPSREVEIEVDAMAGNFWNTGLYPYWESPVTVSGSHSGRGYLELTGYAE